MSEASSIHDFAAFINPPVIWSVIKPLLVNVAAGGGIAVSNFYTKARAIQAKVDSLKKCAYWP